MLAQTLRVSRSTAARMLRRPLVVPRRTLASPTAPRKADLVRDLYLQELRRFKPAPVKASDVEGQVQKFNPPRTPASPEEGNIASELKEYEEQQVEVEGRSTGEGEEGVVADEDDWLEEEDDDDEIAPDVRPTPKH